MFTKEQFEQTAYTMSYAEFRTCYCPDCNRPKCIQREAYRRMPKIDGGLGLCPNLFLTPVIGEDGVMVQIDGYITTYHTIDQAIKAVEQQMIDNKKDYSNIIKQLNQKKVFCSDEIDLY